MQWQIPGTGSPTGRDNHRQLRGTRDTDETARRAETAERQNHLVCALSGAVRGSRKVSRKAAKDPKRDTESILAPPWAGLAKGHQIRLLP